jgi:hypothetical protein
MRTTDFNPRRHPARRHQQVFPKVALYPARRIQWHGRWWTSFAATRAIACNDAAASTRRYPQVFSKVGLHPAKRIQSQGACGFRNDVLSCKIMNLRDT